MTNNKGFTLMEILLAAFIVGIIGVALAALTTAAVRETGVARTRTMLRHQLSVALRQLRQDIEQADGVQIRFNMGTGSAPLTTRRMVLTSNVQLGPGQRESWTITYTFTAGSAPGAGGGTTGGTITRRVEVGGSERTSTWLENVKFIRTENFASPRFAQETWGVNTTEINTLASAIRVTLIVEVPGSPVVNETIDETFMLPHGFVINN
jgi:prepilin-type N-terminal cleavage/methylation domain-containing protein